MCISPVFLLILLIQSLCPTTETKKKYHLNRRLAKGPWLYYILYCAIWSYPIWCSLVRFLLCSTLSNVRTKTHFMHYVMRAPFELQRLYLRSQHRRGARLRCLMMLCINSFICCSVTGWQTSYFRGCASGVCCIELSI